MAIVTAKVRAWLTDFTSQHITPEQLATPEGVERMAFQNQDMSDCGWTLIGVAQITVELVERDELIANKVDALRAERQKALADAQIRVNKIDEQISNLLALPAPVQS